MKLPIESVMSLMVDLGTEELRRLMRHPKAFEIQVRNQYAMWPGEPSGPEAMPDSMEASDLAQHDAAQSESAATVWNDLTPAEQRTLVECLQRIDENVNLDDLTLLLT